MFLRHTGITLSAFRRQRYSREIFLLVQRVKAGLLAAAQSAAYLLPQLAASNELRPAAKLYLAPVLPEAAEAVEFLAAHPGNLTLQRTRAALLYGWQPEVPRLLTTEGGLRLAG